MTPMLTLRQTQQLSLSPQMQQVIRLLQMTTQALEQEIHQILETNPFLDTLDDLSATDPTPPPSPTPPHPSTSPTLPEDEEDGSASWQSHLPVWDDDFPDPYETIAQTPNLVDHLQQQAHCLRLSEGVALALEILIDALNEDGYLPEPLTHWIEVVQTLSHNTPPPSEALCLHWLEQAQHHLQRMDPIGVGAHDLSECLRLQLAEYPQHPLQAIALALCEPEALAWIAKRDTRRLAQWAQCDTEQITIVLQWLQRLEPKPARPFANVQMHRMIPDVIVYKQQNQWRVRLNPDSLPTLQLNTHLADALPIHDNNEPLKQQWHEAKTLVKQVTQRQETLLRVSKAIVAAQTAFFDRGAQAMRPLLLKDIATQLDLHESTISRVTTSKYMATPNGTFELKYFFTTALSDSDHSATAVKALIKQLIQAESPYAPLSDQSLVEQLQVRGISCARRTVSKYREAMRIAPAHQRKQR